MREPTFDIENVTLDQLVDCFRPAVRSEKAYFVGGTDRIRVKLNQNENPYDLPAGFKEELIRTFLEVPFNRYPAEQPERLKTAIAESVGLTPDSVLVGNGSNDLTNLLGISLVEKGAPVVLPRPMFSLYEKIIRIFEGSLTSVPCLPGFGFDVRGLEDAVRRVRPVLTVITTPNNPTGLAISFEEIERIVAVSRGIVVVDEAYVDFNDEPDALSLLKTYPQVVILRTFSKSLGLAGLRIGYFLARPEIIRELARAIIPFATDPLSEAVALAVLRNRSQLLERVPELKRERDRLTVALRRMEGVQVVGPSKTNFVIFSTPLEPKTVISGLANAGILVRDLSGYPELKGFVRVNAGTPDENQLFLDALKELLTQTGRTR